MCAITFLEACTLSRISSARVTFYIQNCFYTELLKKKYFVEKKIFTVNLPRNDPYIYSYFIHENYQLHF